MTSLGRNVFGHDHFRQSRCFKHEVVAFVSSEGFDDLQRPVGISSAKDQARQNRCHLSRRHVSSPLSDHVLDHGLCQGRNRNEPLVLPAASLAGTLAPDLAHKLDGRAPLFFHLMSSAVKHLSAAPKISTRGFQNGGNFFQKTGN